MLIFQFSSPSLSPDIHRSFLGVTALSPGVSLQQALGMECVLTFFVVYAVFASENSFSSKPITAGCAVTVAHLAGVSREY